MPNQVVIGKFGKTFGVRGWIKIHSFATPKEDILKFVPWQIKKNNQFQDIQIESSKIHHQHIVAKLKDVDDIDAAKLYTNLNIFIDRALLPKLKKNEYYWNDLVGLKVINKENVELGTIDHLFATGANDVMVVKGSRERLIPYIKNVVMNIDLENKVIIVDWDKNF